MHGNDAAPTGPLIERVLGVARSELGGAAAYLAEQVGNRLVCRAVVGDGAALGLAVGHECPPIPSRTDDRDELAAATAREPMAVPDPNTAALTMSARLPDGTVYGTLGVVLYDAPRLTEHASTVLQVLTSLVADELASARHDERLRAQLEDFVVAGPLMMAGQPIIDLATGRCTGIEALARFPTDLGSPADVFQAAQRLGLGPDLEWLAAFRALDLLKALHPDQFLTINLSPTVAADLAVRSLPHLHLPWRQLVLEITEHSVVDRYGELRERLAPLRARGLRVAIDDAGAGYASLHHIVELAPDLIKVDASLVHGVAADRARRVAVSAFVLLALDLGATVVAEGVERPADLATLAELGVDAVQGYLLARPTTELQEIRRWADADFAVPHRQSGQHTPLPQQSPGQPSKPTR